MLYKLLIKDYKDTENPRVRTALGMFANVVGIFWNVLLCTAKIAVGTIFRSVAVTADGFNNLADAGSSVISLVGFKMSNRPADKDHPFGHARIEYVTALIISIVILALGFELIVTSVEKLVSGGSADTSVIMMAVLGASILIKAAMFFYYRRFAKKIGSSNLKAAAQDSLNDCVATAAVLVGTLISYFTDAELDGYFGAAVALFIIFSGAKLVKETVSPLLGETPPPELVISIIRKINSYNGVLGTHDLIVHDYGQRRIFCSVHVEVDAQADILESHEMLDKIEREFLERDKIQLVIHMDPIILNDERVNELREKTVQAVKSVNPDYKIHDFRVVWGERRKNLIFDVVVPADEKDGDDVIVAKIFDLLHGEDPTLYVVVNVDKNYIGADFA